jgi:NAD(P)H-flavin reductase
MINFPYVPHEAEIVERIQESPTIFTFRLKFTDPAIQAQFSFQPGQFNMLYLYGVGEVPISIVSDPAHDEFYDHTIRAVGRVTKGLEQLKIGDRIGIRGPYGKGWPLGFAEHKNIIIITGGVGCAPVVSVIHYILARRSQYGNLKILQGLKHSDDFIFHQQYEAWRKIPHTEVWIAADFVGKNWPWYSGRITDMITDLIILPETVVMLCGPEIMMQIAVKELLKKGVREENIFLSMERNMECGVGHCGHCQYGGLFICKDGPIFAYPKIKDLFMEPGF